MNPEHDFEYLVLIAQDDLNNAIFHLMQSAKEPITREEAKAIILWALKGK